MHTHKVNGKIITHSHPYNKSNDSGPIKSHHHSKAHYLFLSTLTVLFLVGILTYLFFTNLIPDISSVPLSEKFTSLCIVLYKGRDPPVS